MNQYTPLENVSNFPEINRKLKKKEYNDIIEYCIRLGIDNAFIQEEGTADESFIPNFNGEGV